MSCSPVAPADALACLPRRGFLRQGLGLAVAAAALHSGDARAGESARLLPALIPDDVLLDYQRFLAGHADRRSR